MFWNNTISVNVTIIKTQAGWGVKNGGFVGLQETEMLKSLQAELDTQNAVVFDV